MSENFEYKTAAWQSDGAASRYDAGTKKAPELFHLVRQTIYIEYIQRYAAPGAKILDVGCGSGMIAMALHDLGFEVVAYDASRDMLDYLDKVRGDRKFELRHGNGRTIPAATGEFDLTTSRMFIQHFSDWPIILAEKTRVTRNGGIVLFDFGSQEHLDASGVSYEGGRGFPYDTDQTNHTSFYAVATAEAMERQADALGLDVAEISPTGLLLYNGFLWNSLKSEGIKAFNSRLDALLQNESAREMLTLIEREVMPKLPKSATYCNLTALRKR